MKRKSIMDLVGDRIATEDECLEVNDWFASEDGQRAMREYVARNPKGDGDRGLREKIQKGGAE